VGLVWQIRDTGSPLQEAVCWTILVLTYFWEAGAGAIVATNGFTPV
jgi:hypothetical protein